MADFYKKKGSRFRQMSSDELHAASEPWVSIEFTEMGGMAVKKHYMSNGTKTYEVHHAPQVRSSLYEWEVVQEITKEEHPFLDALIRERIDEL